MPVTVNITFDTRLRHKAMKIALHEVYIAPWGSLAGLAGWRDAGGLAHTGFVICIITRSCHGVGQKLLHLFILANAPCRCCCEVLQQRRRINISCRHCSTPCRGSVFQTQHQETPNADRPMLLDSRGCSVATTEAAPRGSPAGLTLVHKRYITVCVQAQARHAEDATVIEIAAFAAN